jgi:hypothetical protein
MRRPWLLSLVLLPVAGLAIFGPEPMASWREVLRRAIDLFSGILHERQFCEVSHIP